MRHAARTRETGGHRETARAAAIVTLAAIGLVGHTPTLGAQHDSSGVIPRIESNAAISRSDSRLPFAIGEELEYRVSAGRFGRVGRGTMKVDGPTDVRGHTALLLRFAIRGRIGLVGVENITQSWIETGGFASLRFTKHERQLFRSHDERIDIYPSDRRWSAEGAEGDGGAGGATLTDAPLDELSFIYFLRTLPLEPEATYSLSRHFQAERNPVVVTVIRRETINTPAGDFATILVEMRVKDSRHYEREGLIRLNLTDDRARIPVRIETSMPVVGKTVLALERRTGTTELPSTAVAKSDR